MQARELSARRPGREFALATAADGTLVAAISLLGRTYMRNVDRSRRGPCLWTDQGQHENRDRGHARRNDGDKYLTAPLKGTRTAFSAHHVQTADEQILAGGTAFICDAATGPYDSILAMHRPRTYTTVTFVPTAFDVAESDVRLGGVIVDVNGATGRATAIRRVMLDEAGLARLKNPA